MPSRGVREWSEGAVVLASVLCVSGCIGVYDAAKPSVRVANESSGSVVVRIDGVSDSWTIDVAAGSSSSLVVVEDCMGTAIVVEMPDGAAIGRVDEPACPGRLLTIAADGSLTYEDEG